MSIDTQERLDRRVAELAVNDPEFAAARQSTPISKCPRLILISSTKTGVCS